MPKVLEVDLHVGVACLGHGRLGWEEGCTLLDAPPPPAVTCQAELIAEGQDLSSDSGGQEQGPGATGRKSRGQEPGVDHQAGGGSSPPRLLGPEGMNQSEASGRDHVVHEGVGQVSQPCPGVGAEGEGPEGLRGHEGVEGCQPKVLRLGRGSRPCLRPLCETFEAGDEVYPVGVILQRGEYRFPPPLGLQGVHISQDRGRLVVVGPAEMQDELHQKVYSGKCRAQVDQEPFPQAPAPSTVSGRDG